MEDVRGFATRFPDVKTEVAATQAMGGPMGGGAAIQVDISGSDIRVLTELSEQVKEVVASVPGTREVKTTLEEGAPEAQLHVDREKAALLGVSVAQIASTVRTAYQGSVPTRLRLGGDEYDIRVIMSAKGRQRLQDLSHLTLVSARGGLVSLGDVATIEIKAGPTSVQRKEQTRVVTVSAALFQRDLGSVSRDVRQRIKTINVPGQYKIDIAGSAFDMNQSFSDLGVAMLFAIVLVYMVLALQYESLMNPLVILFSIPLMGFGVTWSLFATGRPLNVTGLTGAIMLTGIVVNNAIVLIDYVETLHHRGMSRLDEIGRAHV